MKNILLFIIFLFICSTLFSVIVETESLKDFLYGSALDCEYDNWLSHLAEGIASPGYNIYASYDRQTDGFGSYVVPADSMLLIWGNIIDNFLLENLQAAQDSIDHYNIPYQVVIFNDTDSNQTFYILREIPNMDHYDDNGTTDFYDDEHGAFDYGWGLYIYNPVSSNPHITTGVHPGDDYIIVPLAHKIFIEHGSKFLLISGSGREVLWTNSGNYDNSKSLSDPSRNEEHIFNVSYQRFCDLIREEFGMTEFSIQIHSFDWGQSHYGYSDVQISGGYYVGSPDLPIRDHSSLRLDVTNLLPEYVLPANYVGIHDPVHTTEYFAFHSNEYAFNFSNEDTTFAVDTHTDLWGWSGNRQIIYTQSGMNHYDNFERFFHIEVDELPNIYPQTVSNYQWFHGWDPVTQRWDLDQRFENSMKYNLPWIESMGTALTALFEMDDNEIPVAPTNLEVVTECADKIKLVWTQGDCYDMDSYEILFSTEPIANGNYSVIDRTNLSRLACLAQNNYTFHGLSPGDQLYFAVRIRDKNNNYSELSNEVFGTAGPVKVYDLEAYGRDEEIHLTWKEDCDTTFYGFNVYRMNEFSGYELLDSWQNNPELIGATGTDVSYTYIDQGTENDLIYTYQISYEDEEDEYFFGDEPGAVSRKIFLLRADVTTSAANSKCYFGFNEFASNGYDSNFDIPADLSTFGNYIITEFYEENWDNSPNQLEQEIYSAFDPEHSYKSWIYRIKTNILNVPFEIRITNLERDAERIYLLRSGVYTDLVTSSYTLTPTSENYYTFTLYYGNLKPNVTYTDFANQLLYPFETVHFDWSVNLQAIIDHVNVYAANEEISIPIEMGLAPSVTEVYWTVPQLLMEDLQCRVDLVMAEGDTISHLSPFKFGIISPQNIVQVDYGWNLLTKNFQTGLYTPEQIFGEFVEFYQFQNDDFTQITDPEFLHPYWINSQQYNYFEMNNAEMLRNAYTFPLSAGWNLLPNPHRINYDIDQLVFSLNNQDFEYYQALQNQLIDPVIFSYEETFRPSLELTPAEAYYIYCHEDGLNVKFIPYYTGEYYPEISLDWKVELLADQLGTSRSSLIVGTSEIADSFYDPNLDILKPVHYPFEIPLSVYLPMQMNDVTERMYQSIINSESDSEEFEYSWDAELSVNELLPVIFSANDLEIPEGYELGLVFGDVLFDLSLNNSIEYTPFDTLIGFTIVVSEDLTGSEDPLPPLIYSLSNFPNPFNPNTTIKFDLPEEEKVTLVIYNIKGQKVKQLYNDRIPAGSHSIEWNGEDENNIQISSGVYLYRLEIAGKRSITNKMLLLK